jgi:hypothetical protein
MCFSKEFFLLINDPHKSHTSLSSSALGFQFGFFAWTAWCSIEFPRLADRLPHMSHLKSSECEFKCLVNSNFLYDLPQIGQSLNTLRFFALYLSKGSLLLAFSSLFLPFQRALTVVVHVGPYIKGLAESWWNGWLKFGVHARGHSRVNEFGRFGYGQFVAQRDRAGRGGWLPSRRRRWCRFVFDGVIAVLGHDEPGWSMVRALKKKEKNLKSKITKN